MDLPLPPRQLTPEENQILEDFRKKQDKLSLVEKFKMGIDGTEVYTIKNGEVVIQVDALKDRLDIFDFVDMTSFKNLIDFEEDEEYAEGQEPLPDFSELTEEKSLPIEKAEESANKKLYGKNEIMELLGCGSQKALNFLKLLFQMQYAIKIGKSYIVKADDFDRFFEDFKGKEISI